MYTKAEIKAKLNTLEAAADPGLSFAGVNSAIDLVGGSSGNPPAGYEDISTLFNTATGDEIMEITVEEFNAATYTETDPTTQVTTVRNTYLDSWTASYTATASSVVTNLGTLAEWCNGQGMGNSIQTLLQPKEIKSVPDRAEMSRTIYIDRKAKDVILAYELDVLIPEVVS